MAGLGAAALAGLGTKAYLERKENKDDEEEIEAEESKPTPIKDEPRELIKGISGLAEFLSCGTTKAQSIMNSGILQERGIAYRAGNRWRFNKTLLMRLLEEEPEILNELSLEAA